VTLRFRRLSAAARPPVQAHEGDAGFDLHAAEAVTIGPGERASVGTGIAVAIPDGQAGLVIPRSGLAARHGISVVNAPGLIDSGYRGEIQVVLLNTDRKTTFSAEAGERIAQLVILPLPEVALKEVEELPPSERGVRGFGSSRAV
jgi:dUTP pyrophosphatase